jgi:hypothetical protein
VKGCSRIDSIGLGEYAVYNNLAKRKLLIVRFGFCGNRARASRDLGRASARYSTPLLTLSVMIGMTSPSASSSGRVGLDIGPNRCSYVSNIEHSLTISSLS